MISLDQVLLLEEKVESAVEKIQQLEAENDALRSKCSELTNALSAKSEQLAAYESEQNKIESGIIKAIDRLKSIENSVLKAAGQTAPAGLAAAAAKVAAAEQAPSPVEEPAPVEQEEIIEESVETEEEQPAMNFDSMEPVTEEPDFEEEIPQDSDNEQESTDELGFDIF